MDEKVNTKGQTLKEFLAAYDPAKYHHPAVTADCVVFCGDNVLLVRRGNHPHIGELAFPGGFAEPGESTEITACRELEEETGIAGVSMRQFYTVSTPGRDPRDWTVSICYIAELSKIPPVTCGDDAADARFYHCSAREENGLTVLTLSGAETTEVKLRVRRDDFNKVDVNATEVLGGGVAFDHAKILLRAMEERK